MRRRSTSCWTSTKTAATSWCGSSRSRQAARGRQRWTTVDAAKTAVAALTDGSETPTMMPRCSPRWGHSPPPKELTGPGTQNVSYLLSDGDPTANGDWPSIPGTLRGRHPGQRRSCVGELPRDQRHQSFALGMGSGVRHEARTVAYDGTAGVPGPNPAIIVTDLGQLQSN